MSIAAIAADAGVTKPTIYRRWPSKADLVTAALAHLQEQAPPPTTGVTREDLCAILRNVQTTLLRPHGMALLGTLLVEERHAPELIELFRERVLRPRRAMLRAVLERAQQRDELRLDVSLEAAVNMLVGSYYARYLTGDGLPYDWSEQVVAAVWDGIARPDAD
jgi:AcrR family transcriptional regulator